MLNPRRFWTAVPLIAAPLVVAMWVPAASADSCKVMTVRYDLSRAGFVVLDPSHYDIPYDGCVQFVNQTAATATITVGSHYRQQVGPNENTSGATNFNGEPSGRQAVTATSGAAGSAHGSITVGKAPTKPSSAPSSPEPRPKPSHRPSHTSAPARPPSPATSTGGGPRIAPTPGAHRPGHHPRGGLQPPVPAPGPIQTQSPTPTPSPAATTVVSGPVEPASGRGVGLPAALASLALVGSGAAFLRVLAAEPVDSPETVADRT